MNDKKSAINLRISGLVQGVGFRPFIYRVAHELGLAGTVRNQTDGVSIHAEGSTSALDAFIDRLRSAAPTASSIDEIRIAESAMTGATAFIIVQSAHTLDQVTRVSPDLPVCDDCLDDIRGRSGTPGFRRTGYPFTNCTNCGPRFSIVTALPYDRPQTTMAPFRMCDDCRTEYENVLDRRFHAQPVACRVCGPRYSLVNPAFEVTGRAPDSREPASDEPIPDEPAALVAELADALDSGQIVAMKGIGGYHLSCDATNEEAVVELRRRKRREAKPFAVMFASVDSIRAFAPVSDAERVLLESSARPIVLLEARDNDAERRTSPEPAIAPSVGNRLRTIGAVLPYMPMHHLLFDRLKTPAVVLTSGNLSSEPIVTSNRVAGEVLGPIADLLLTHDRDIHNRQDDSVTMVAGGRPRIVRRSRGYVPTPIRLPFDVDGIVAVGAEQKNTLCFGSGNEAILSQHIGDLDDMATLQFAEEILDRFPRLFRVTPRLFVRDLHPDYLSTELAQNSGCPVASVGHHHAHVASCMAEHGLNGDVIGVALDGTGYGDDGNIWGGEILVGGYSRAERFAHFDYVPLPGGDLAADNPWRSGISYLVRAYGPDGPPSELRNRLVLFDPDVLAPHEREAALHALIRGINAPLTSSAGRLFDAVAAICGVCTHSLFDAEAPIRLTDCVVDGISGHYPFEIADSDSGQPRRIRFDGMIRRIVDDITAGSSAGLIASLFHNTICESIAETARLARDHGGLNRVVLSGGVFQNRHVLAGTERLLGAAGFEVYSHEMVPSNDGGIALGQIAIAAAAEREKD